jgi:alpha-1,2-mannosyltransferase
MLTVYLLPRFVNTDGFLGNLLAMHGLLGVPLLLPLKRTAINGAEPAESTLSIPFPALYALLVAAAAGIHLPATTRLIKSLPLHRHLPTQLFRTMLAHPAQTSISMDVLWVFATLLFWFVTSGSTVSIVLKVLSVAAAGLAVASTQANINWALVGSIMPIVILLSVGLAYMSIQRIRTRNAERRKVVLDGLGIIEDGVVPGTKDKPPSKAGKKVVVGFWHPYWYVDATLRPSQAHVAAMPEEAVRGCSGQPSERCRRVNPMWCASSTRETTLQLQRTRSWPKCR